MTYSIALLPIGDVGQRGFVGQDPKDLVGTCDNRPCNNQRETVNEWVCEVQKFLGD